MAGTAIRVALVVMGFVFIGVFVWTLVDPEIPVIWTGAIFIGLYLLYKGATYEPKIGQHRHSQSVGRNYSINREGRHHGEVLGAQPRMSRNLTTPRNDDIVIPHCCACGKLVESRWLACPYCGVDYRDVCRFCGEKLKKSWIACPSCAADLPGH